MAKSHIWNVNIPASKLMNYGATSYPSGEKSFQFEILDAVRDSHCEIRRAEYTECTTAKKRRLKASLKSSISPKTGKHAGCGMSISPNLQNLRDMKIDHLDGDRLFLVTETNRETFLIHTGNNFPAITNKDEVPCITANLKKANNAFENNKLFELEKA
jgi:hypothetical protein